MAELRPDVQAAKDRMAATLGAGRELKKIPEHLWEGEVVHHLAAGQYGKGQGLLALTSHRLLFTYSGWGSSTTEDFGFDKISSVQWSSGVLTGTITIFASGNKAEVKNVNKDDGKSIVDQIRGIISKQTAPQAQVAPAAAAAPTDDIEQLRKLGELREAGILTEEEFAAKKAQILGI